jgi:vacuolar-type H+-ATPase subunit I/STV1
MSNNEITFMNSYKMKISIIIGVCHMMSGLFLKGLNAIYFGASLDFFFEFIPQVLFLGGIFGYMCVLIIVKWLTNWDGQTPPQIINIFTNFTTVIDGGVLLWDKESQQLLQEVILCKFRLTSDLHDLRSLHLFPEAR